MIRIKFKLLIIKTIQYSEIKQNIALKKIHGFEEIKAMVLGKKVSDRCSL